MMETISTGISPKFVKDWTVEEAIREIIQNYLDSRKEFNCRGCIAMKDGRAIVHDYGPGIELRHLALGISEKSGSAIGKFGKGLKQALLVMAREKRDILIVTNGQVIEPIIEFDDNFKTETLKFKLYEADSEHKDIKGTWIEFDCSRDELDAGKSYFVYFLGNTIKMLGSSMSLPGGSVYVNGSKVGTVDDALLSYHLTYDDSRDIMSSDRDIIDKDKLGQLVRIILLEAPLQAKKLLIKEATRHDSDGFETNVGILHWAASQKDAREWVEAWTDLFGEYAVISNPDFDAYVKYCGFTPISGHWRWMDALEQFGVTTAASVTQTIGKSKLEIINPEDLEPIEYHNFKRACSLVSSYYDELGDIKIVESLNHYLGIPASQLITGCYLREDDIIYIKRKILGSLEWSVTVILHEVTHKYSGKIDCTPEFEAALCSMAAHLLLGKRYNH